MGRTLPAVALVVAIGCAGCTSDGPEPAGSSTRAPSTPASSASAPVVSDVPSDVPSDDLVVIGHVTRPQLRLNRRDASRILGGEVDRWRGLRIVRGLDPGELIRAVERDPDTVAAVPLDEVGPTVTVAQVAGRDPVRDHPDAVDVTVAGDVMLVRGVPDAAAALAPMSGRLAAADLTVGNLESTLSRNGSPTQGGDSFGGSPALLGPLADAGFDALSLANNHTGDFGERALLETVRAFRGSGIESFGAGADLRAASRPAYVESGGVRFAFVGFNAIGETPRATASTPGALSVRMPPRTGPLVPADLRHVERVVRRAAEQADVVIVLPHWGHQYTHHPWPSQRPVGRALVRAGADLVVGGHPHWVQGVDSVRHEGAGVPLLHSLGNFVFDMETEQTREGVVLETTFWGGTLKALRLVPYRMDPSTLAPRVLRGAAAAGVLADVWSTSTGPYAAR